jgi:hypothetical protein
MEVWGDIHTVHLSKCMEGEISLDIHTYNISRFTEVCVDICVYISMYCMYICSPSQYRDVYVDYTYSTSIIKCINSNDTRNNSIKDCEGDESCTVDCTACISKQQNLDMANKDN